MNPALVEPFGLTLIEVSLNYAQSSFMVLS